MTRANVQVFSGDTDISSNLEVGGNTNLSSNLTVTGNTYISSNLTVVGNTYIESDLVLTGNATVTGIVGTSTMGGLNLPYGTTVERPNPAAVGTIRYNTDLKYVEAKTEAGWLVITSPPVISGVSPLNVSVDGIPTLKEWDLRQAVTHNVPTASDQFGHCVDISADGNYMIVGTPFDDIPNLAGTLQGNSGSALIFIRAPSGDTTPSGTQWTYQATLSEPVELNVISSEYFGYSVSISNDGMYAIVGGYDDVPVHNDGDGTTTANSDHGSAIAFRRKPDGTWEYMDKLVHPLHPQYIAGDEAGRSCALSGDGRYAILGARYDDPHNARYDYSNDTTVSQGGAAHIFIRDASGKWSHQVELTDMNVKANDWFGYSVDIDDDGTYVAIGAPSDDRTNTDMGSVHIFKRDGTTWTQQIELFNYVQATGNVYGGPSYASTEWFGWSVSLSGNAGVLAVGAYMADAYTGGNDQEEIETRIDAGVVHMFRKDGDEWQREQVLTSYYIDDVDKYDWFGYDVAVSNDGNYVVIGAPRDEHAAATGINAHGVSHLYQRLDSVWTYVRRLFDPVPEGLRSAGQTNASQEMFGYSVAISGDGKYIANGVPFDKVFVNSTEFDNAGAVQLFTASDVAGSNVVPSTEDEVFTVTGTGFTQGTIVKLVGVDGSLCDVFDTVIDANQTEITFKMGRNETTGGYDLEKRPYKVKVISDTGLATTSTDTIKLGGRWISPGLDSVFPFDITNASPVTLEAVVGVDAAGGNEVTYGINPATPLPNGVFVNSATGVVSGQTSIATTTNVKVRVIDTVTQGYEERNMQFVGYDAAFHFTSHTFSPCGIRGNFGPTLAEQVTYYKRITPSIPWDQTSILDIGTLDGSVSAHGFQKFTIPKDGIYQIDAYGARGGDGDYYIHSLPGKGARVRANFTLLRGDKIIMIVGHQGPPSHASNGASGGGGGTYVLKNQATTSPDDIYLIAGGGTGMAEYGAVWYDAPNADGSQQGTTSSGGAGGGENYGGGGGWSGNGTGNTNSYGRHPHANSSGGANAGSTRGTVGGFGGGGGGYWSNGGGGGGFRGGRGNYYSWTHPDGSNYPSQSWIMPDSGSQKISGTGDFLGNHSENDGKVIVTYMGPV